MSSTPGVWQATLGIGVIVASALCAACEKESDFILETSPFAETQVRTPPDGKTAIRARGRVFAERHAMKVHYVPDHFEEHEYSLALIRPDLNITAMNVMHGENTVVRAYVRGGPTDVHRREVDEYLCEVMLHDCA